MEKEINIKNICCIGAGYVGGPTMAVIADKCPHLNIFVVDKNTEKIDLWNSEDLEKLPVYEPGLKEIIKRTRNKNLFFTSEIANTICKADMIFISVNTPIKTKGVGAGQASNLCWVESSTREIAIHSSGHTIVVEKSTLPVRTASIIKKILNSAELNQNTSFKKSFSVLSNPEFLAEGSAIKDLLFPDRILIGGESEDAVNSLKNIYKNWVNEEKIISTNLWSSELSKLAANAFLAQRISSINSISALCEATGADVKEVSTAIGLDKRIGTKFLNAGPGFGGSCFKKDILNLVYLCNYFGLKEVADFWEQVIILNSWQQKRIYEQIVNKLFGNLVNKRIAILGVAFKANTNDTRESPSISISKLLLNEGAFLVFNDPKVSAEKISIDLQENVTNSSFQKWDYEEDIYLACKEADAIIILTEWEEYKNLNWEKISSQMNFPAWVFDTRNILRGEEIRKNGIKFWCLGDGQ